MIQKYMFEVRFILFCIAGAFWTAGMTGLYGVKLSTTDSPAAIAMANPILTLIAGGAVLALLLMPPKWLDYKS